MTAAQLVLYRAAMDARDYFDRKVCGHPSRGVNDDLRVGRELTAALLAVELEEMRITEVANTQQFEARR